MYVNLREDWVCSRCETKNNVEHFRQKWRKGIRCLTCGHEKITEKESDTTGDTTQIWVARKEEVTF